MSIGFRSKLALVQCAPRYKVTQTPAKRLDQMTAVEQARFWHKPSALKNVRELVKRDREERFNRLFKDLP